MVRRNLYVAHMNPWVAHMNQHVAALNLQKAIMNPQLAHKKHYVAHMTPQVAQMNPQLALMNPHVAHMNSNWPIWTPNWPIWSWQLIIVHPNIFLTSVFIWQYQNLVFMEVEGYLYQTRQLLLGLRWVFQFIFLQFYHCPHSSCRRYVDSLPQPYQVE